MFGLGKDKKTPKIDLKALVTDTGLALSQWRTIRPRTACSPIWG